MSNMRELMALADRMGIDGADFKAWYEEKEARAREERAAEREARKEQLERETQAKKEQLELETREKEKQLELETRAKKEQLELENQNLQLRLRLAEAESSRVETRTVDSAPGSAQERSVSCSVNPHKLIPGFNESRDDLDAYLKRFERVAIGQEWPRDKWATALSLCLSGEALKVFGRLSPEDSLDYDKAKLALLQRFRFTAEGYREKFRQSKPQDGETGKQYATRLLSFFDRWVEMSRTGKEYSALRNLIVTEQFLRNCHHRLALFLREKNFNKLEDMAEASDNFLEAQRQVNLLVFREKVESKSNTEKSGSYSERGAVRCFVCGKMGHRASECRSRSKQPFCGYCQKAGHDSKTCSKKNGSANKTSCLLSPEEHSTEVKLSPDKEEDMAGAVNTHPKFATHKMPVLQGRIFGRTVSVLRDTGSNTLVVRRSLVPDEALIGTTATLFLADGSSIIVPEAEVEIHSPYFSGTSIVKCMTNPLYDLIVGNVPGSREVHDPDTKWEERIPVKTYPNYIASGKGADREDGTLKSSVVGIKIREQRSISSEIDVPTLKTTRKDLSAAQKQDKTLDSCRSKVGQGLQGGSKSYSFEIEKGLLYRYYHLPSGKVIQQVVVPQRLRSQVLTLAHETLMSGHQGIKRTIDRVLQSFYWPGVQEAVRRYVRSCDACQRTYPKSRVGKAPLGRMPLIDTPFERVAVDIIGPLKPISHMGNRYILTLVDFATRYPDAIALPSIDSATVAEALVEMFSRIGFPREVLCDQASCFTSELMREVNDLLAIKHLSSTPYHPMCNGLVERFNGTLKQMLRKLCQEEPKTWDRLLAPLLFAYREVPQASLGFSPFELIYGRNVRGPLSLLKELWTGDNQSEEVKTTYGYVLDLRDRLEKTLQLAQENLSRAKTTQKKYYDRGSRMRRLKVGDRALVLLPTTENKLMMHWKGPFRVTGKKGDSDYWLDMGHTTKLFHINMLKRYEERPPEISPQSASFIVVEEEETAFETLKQALASGPILKAPDLKRGFVLRSDASDSCIGAVLMQEHDGVLYPVKYASRQLLPREQNYSTIERECLALVWAVEKFHIFLYGTYFTVQTDHQPLQYLSRAKHLNSRVLRWSLVLQEYNFHVEHIKGSENVGADYMSRLQ
ncbi:uncharacterized protein LOC142775667 [Rhipicephalus microplus]|uniref:uncharacterized protein LOC142775667 n=1 Tax=Rhipicephalus microplus TaxID=6941 RepID=UPI003F6B1BEB